MIHIAKEAALLQTAIESYPTFKKDMNEKNIPMEDGSPWPDWSELPEHLKKFWIDKIREVVE